MSYFSQMVGLAFTNFASAASGIAVAAALVRGIARHIAKTIGKKGHAIGELFYPTDVQLVNGLIYVADAYNNRVQVFDVNGNSKEIIGSNDSINVATGMTVYKDNLFVADFFNNRILIFDINGNLVQGITDKHINHPSDLYVHENKLFISNYWGSSIIYYKYR